MVVRSLDKLDISVYDDFFPLNTQKEIFQKLLNSGWSYTGGGGIGDDKLSRFWHVDGLDNDRDIKKIFRIKAGMFVKNQTEKPHLAHVDRPYFHYTMLYYVNDSDGPTQLYDEKGGKVVKEIEPKKGRAVILDGNIYHASSCPKNHVNRIVINYNFLI